LIEFLAPPQAADELGRLGGFRILKILGHGGMGVVFQGEDPRLGRKVAIKAMLPYLAGSRLSQERFLREARTAAALENDHIVPILQVGEDRGAPFIVMPLLKGESLEVRLQREGKLPVPVILRVGREIAEGLAAAHGACLIHRDIKPSNIWLEAPLERVKILDFGLARATTVEETILTQTGAIIGTPAYMAPEQAAGESLDSRCDLFSLGCVLYRLCAGKPPFQGRGSMATLMAVANENPSPPLSLNVEVPPELSDLVMHMLAKDPAKRPDSARAVIESIARIEQALGTAAPGSGQAVQTGKQTTPGGLPTLDLPGRTARRGQRWRLAASAAALVLLAGLGIWALTALLGHRPDAVPAAPVISEKPGRPLSALALVQRQVQLPGVRSWTIETVAGRGGRFNGGAVGSLPMSLALRPAGNVVAVVVGDGSIRLWDVRGKKLARILIGHGQPAEYLSWSPDGRWLLSCGKEQTCLWNADTGQLRHRFEPALGSWSPDGSQILFRPNAGPLWLCDAGSLQRVGAAFPEVPNANFHAVWSPDGKTIAVSFLGSKEVWLCDVANRKPPRIWKSLGAAPGVAWSPDGKKLLTGGPGCPFELWDPKTNKSRPFAWDDSKGAVIQFGFAPDGKICFLTYHNEFHRLDPTTGGLVGTIASWRREWLASSFSLSAKCDALAIRDEAGRIAVVQIPSREICFEKTGHPYATGFAWSPVGDRIAHVTRGAEESLRVWAVASGEQSKQIPANLRDVGDSSVAWSPDGGKLAVNASFRQGPGVQIVNAALLKPEAKLLPGVRGKLAWSPDGKRLAIGRHDQSRGEGKEGVEIWDFTAGKLLPGLKIGKDAAPVDIAWSPDGKTIVVTVADKLELWDPDKGERRQKLGRPGIAPQLLAWSSDSHSLAASEASSLSLWDPVRGKLLRSHSDNGGGPSAMTWSANGNALTLYSPWRPVVWRWDLKPPVVVPCGRILVAPRRDPNDFPIEVFFFSAGRMCGAVPSAPLHPDGALRLYKTRNAQPTGALVPLAKGRWLAVSALGHYRGSRDIEREIVYVVETDQGQEMLTPAEFARRFGWKNDPSKVRPLGDPREDTDDVELLPPPAGAILLSDWLDESQRAAQWQDGVLVVKGEEELVSKQHDSGSPFLLHVEFRLPSRTALDRDAVLVQGRYPVKIADPRPGVWQSLEVKVIPARRQGGQIKPARLSVWRNDILQPPDDETESKVRADRVAEPGPTILQGTDGGIQFRNLWMLPLPKE
jgi:WD40 repeat protein